MATKSKTSNKPAAKQAGTEVVPMSATAQTFAAAQAALAAKLPGFRVAKQITMPVLKMEIDKLYALKITDALRVSTYKGEKDEKPADICGVIDMTTGALHTFLVPAVVKKNIEDNYPDNSYIGKVFAVQKLPKRPGKRYFDFNIAEIEEDGGNGEDA